MIDDHKSSKDAFNAAAGKNSAPQPVAYVTDASETNKDNAAQRHDPPSQANNPVPNLAPPGMSGNKAGGSPTPAPDEWEVEVILEGYEEEPEIDVTRTPDLIDGRFDNGIEFLIKQEGELSPQNLEGGLISRLTLVEDGEPIAHFDNAEWVKDGHSDEQLDAIEILKERFNGLDRNNFRSFNDGNLEPTDGFDP